MEPKSSSPDSQVPATCPYPEPALSSPYSPFYFRKIHLNIILSSTPGSPQWSPSLRFPPKTLYTPKPPPYVLHSPPISLFSILSPEQNWGSGIDHEAIHYVVFSIPVLPRPFLAQLFSPTPYSQTHSAYVPPSMWATKFHTHTKIHHNARSGKCKKENSWGCSCRRAISENEENEETVWHSARVWWQETTDSSLA